MAKDENFIGFRLCEDDEDIANALASAKNRSKRLRTLIRLGIMAEAQQRISKPASPLSVPVEAVDIPPVLGAKPLAWNKFPESRADLPKEKPTIKANILGNSF